MCLRSFESSFLNLAILGLILIQCCSADDNSEVCIKIHKKQSFTKLKKNCVFFSCAQDNSNGQCVWYGVCKSFTDYSIIPFTNKNLYCKYNGAPKQLKSDAFNSLNQYCSHLNKGEGNTYTCCDNEQARFHYI